MLICNYMLSFGGQDYRDKHGISEVTATRLGGIAIVTYMVMHLGYQAYLDVYHPGALHHATTILIPPSHTSLSPSDTANYQIQINYATDLPTPPWA